MRFATNRRALSVSSSIRLTGKFGARKCTNLQDIGRYPAMYRSKFVDFTYCNNAACKQRMHRIRGEFVEILGIPGTRRFEPALEDIRCVLS